MIYNSIFENERVSKIKKIINVTILLHSIVEDTQSKTELELIKDIKTFLPNKKNNQETLKQNFGYLSDI